MGEINYLYWKIKTTFYLPDDSGETEWFAFGSSTVGDFSLDDVETCRHKFFDDFWSSDICSKSDSKFPFGSWTTFDDEMSQLSESLPQSSASWSHSDDLIATFRSGDFCRDVATADWASSFWPRKHFQLKNEMKIKFYFKIVCLSFLDFLLYYITISTKENVGTLSEWEHQ
jgi:hypothetical protein